MILIVGDQANCYLYMYLYIYLKLIFIISEQYLAHCKHCIKAYATVIAINKDSEKLLIFR